MRPAGVVALAYMGALLCCMRYRVLQPLVPGLSKLLGLAIAVSELGPHR
jgi:hypothetical protein